MGTVAAALFEVEGLEHGYSTETRHGRGQRQLAAVTPRTHRTSGVTSGLTSTLDVRRQLPMREMNFGGSN